MTRTRVILSVLAALLVAAWFSPCCCQSAWVTAQLSYWVNPGQDEATCCCKKGTKSEEHKDCCPLGGKKCKQSGAKLATAKPASEAPIVTAWWVWAPAGACEEPASAFAAWGRSRVESPPRPDGTLVGLHCALVI